MRKVEDFCVEDVSTVKEAISVIQKNLCRCVIVVNQHKKVVGVFSEGDVLRSILNGVELYTPLKRIMKPSFQYLNNENMTKAFELIKKYGITLIPVINEDFALTNIITIFDILENLTFNEKK